MAKGKEESLFCRNIEPEFFVKRLLSSSKSLARLKYKGCGTFIRDC